MKYYEILDVRPGATVETVRKAYVELAHVWDPEQHVNNPPLRRIAEEKRKKIDAAYSALQSFLPDLSHGLPAAPADPVRPTDAISDVPAAAPETSIALYSFLAFLIVATIASASFLLWRSIHHASAVSSAALPE